MALLPGWTWPAGPTRSSPPNSSSLSVTALAAGTQCPARVAGLHFFNPAPVMKLVEVISTVLTAPGTGEALARLARELGKTPVQVSDRAGFIVNTLLLPYLNHAARQAIAAFQQAAQRSGEIGQPIELTVYRGANLAEFQVPLTCWASATGTCRAGCPGCRLARAANLAAPARPIPAAFRQHRSPRPADLWHLPGGVMNASVADGVADGPRRPGTKDPVSMTVVPARFTPWGI